MTNESQSQHANVTALRPDPITDGAASGDPNIDARPATPEPTDERGVAWVSMEVYARQQTRICELEAQVEALSKELESVIMKINQMSRHFSGLASVSK